MARPKNRYEGKTLADVPPDVLITQTALQGILRIGRMTLIGIMKDPDFPPGLSPGEGRHLLYRAGALAQFFDIKGGTLACAKCQARAHAARSQNGSQHG